MGVFGTVIVNSTNGTVFGHKGTLQDEVMNYSFGVCLVLLMPVGITCNLLVFRYNTVSSDSKTLSALFYRFLSALDLMICCFRTHHQIYALLRPEHETRFYVTTPISLPLRLVSLLILNYTMLVMEVVSLLGLVRFIAVGFPLLYRHYTAYVKLVFTALLVSLTLIILGLNLDYFGYFGAGVYWINVIQWVVSSEDSAIISTLNLYIPGTGLILAALTSTATVFCLVRSDDRAAHSRGSVTVMLMNLGLIIYLVLLFSATQYLPFGKDTMLKYLKTGQYEVYYFYYFVGTYMPLLLAVYNPLVVSMGCQGIKTKWPGVFSSRVETESTL
ncbi:uncharacterized protein LOC134819200 [Bolinopsis microptera]|uniref:uncharacterized protein LOC134819200 n=1 Tax=Bolinopsis microptera TaxID=2820187 RepID=UPI003079AFB7